MSRTVSFTILLWALLLPVLSVAKLNVITTTTNLQSLVKVIAEDKVDLISFSKGTQDPHYLEAKPSYMLKAHKADLLISIGLELEVGWLPLIIRGARNPKLRPGESGSFIAGDYIEALEKPTVKLSRADGDIHPDGNPHFLLDPLNALKVAEAIKNRLSKMDKNNASFYAKNFTNFSKKVHSKLLDWKKKVSSGLKVITYHKTFTYFYHRFNIKSIAFLEPKPGIPPTAAHILNVIDKAKEKSVKLVLVENYFDPAVAKRIVKNIPSLKIKTVPVAVGGERGIDTIIQLYDRLVTAVSDT